MRIPFLEFATVEGRILINVLQIVKIEMHPDDPHSSLVFLSNDVRPVEVKSDFEDLCKVVSDYCASQY